MLVCVCSSLGVSAAGFVLRALILCQVSVLFPRGHRSYLLDGVVASLQASRCDAHVVGRNTRCVSAVRFNWFLMGSTGQEHAGFVLYAIYPNKRHLRRGNRRWGYGLSLLYLLKADCPVEIRFGMTSPPAETSARQLCRLLCVEQVVFGALSGVPQSSAPSRGQLLPLP